MKEAKQWLVIKTAEKAMVYAKEIFSYCKSVI
ncbi:MAG: hypothetical protein PWP18_502 [Thermoanaerobacter sp.]|jgi:hypothetical protein|uniref:HEPN domain-containing protein n=1 Tax=Thermoanaerobacter pentosaceus TaxID=694059 RepID=A0ABT9M779_9THEO|nr:hypothetical protein [Thermoanaerobacter sp.]MDP9751967.1 hypothetical protein [Thermoanaerobacter pentosaceus]